MKEYLKKNLVLHFTSYSNDFVKEDREKYFFVYSESLEIGHQIDRLVIRDDFNIDLLRNQMVDHFMNDPIFIQKYKIFERNNKLNDILFI